MLEKYRVIQKWEIDNKEGVLARSEGGSGPASAESVQDDFAADVRELDPSSPVFGKIIF